MEVVATYLHHDKWFIATVYENKGVRGSPATSKLRLRACASPNSVTEIMTGQCRVLAKAHAAIFPESK
jgi:hypothetical protein